MYRSIINFGLLIVASGAFDLYPGSRYQRPGKQSRKLLKLKANKAFSE
jgi:hypothetical protein